MACNLRVPEQKSSGGTVKLEFILMVGQGRQWYHKLRSELRSSEYRLLRARNQRVASWLMERVKVGLVVVVPDGDRKSTRLNSSHT